MSTLIVNAEIKAKRIAGLISFAELMAQLTSTPLVAKLLAASPPTSAASAAGAKP